MLAISVHWNSGGRCAPVMPLVFRRSCSVVRRGAHFRRERPMWEKR
jgi:hypothetical protein